MNPRLSIVSLCLSAAVLLSGCDALQLGVETATPTAQPATTVPVTTVPATTVPATTVPATTVPATSRPTVAPTLVPATLAATLPAATASSAPADTAAPTTAPTSLPPTAAASDTPAPLPTGQASAVVPTLLPGQPQVAESILILTPGGNSSVASPVRVSGESDPTFEQNLVIKITDANGTVLTTQATTIQGSAVRGPFEVQVPFTVSADGPGRISVYSTSPRDGGLVHLASVDVTLTTGAGAPVASQPHNETHILLSPAAQAAVSGGTLHVTGFSDYVFESQLGLALCGEGGSGAPDEICGTADNVIVTGTAMLNAADVGQPGPFAGDLAYHITAPVSARLVVFSRSARDGGLVHLSSVPIQLAP